jgi:hypothetical protein
MWSGLSSERWSYDRSVVLRRVFRSTTAPLEPEPPEPELPPASGSSSIVNEVAVVSAVVSAVMSAGPVLVTKPPGLSSAGDEPVAESPRMVVPVGGCTGISAAVTVRSLVVVGDLVVDGVEPSVSPG